MKTKLLPIITIYILLVLQYSCTKESKKPGAILNCKEYTSHPNHAKYVEILNTYVSQSAAPGSVIGVKKFQQEEWIGSKGYSNLDNKTEFKTCTPFRSGSITKLVTAVIIMQLFDEKKITLEATVKELLPELQNRIPQSDKITIKQLLNHSSGLKQPTDDDLNYQLTIINNPNYIANMDYKKRLENYIFDKPLKNNPGNDSYYSNAGYWILGLMIEKVTGKTVQKNIEERIVNPLQLSSTYLEKRENNDVSRGYNFSGNLLKDVTIWDMTDSDGDPAAGIITNTRDLLIFSEALFKGNMVSDSALNLMKITTTFNSCNGDCGYGLGLETWKTKEYIGYGKNGTSMGVDANLIFFPIKDITIVIFSNYGGGNRKDIIDDLLNI